MSDDQETAWLERMHLFLHHESPEETEDHLKAADEVVKFMNNGGAWDDFPFPEGELPDMKRTVATLGLSLSRADYLGWFGGSIRDLINVRERGTRCQRCRAHVQKWWRGNEAFEREVARLSLEAHGGDASVAKYSVNPELFEEDCVLYYLDSDAASRVKRLIDGIAVQ